MQRLVKYCLRAPFFSADLELPAKGTQAPRVPCGYGALVRRFTARRYSATAEDALRLRSVYRNFAGIPRESIPLEYFPLHAFGSRETGTVFHRKLFPTTLVPTYFTGLEKSSQSSCFGGCPRQKRQLACNLQVNDNKKFGFKGYMRQ
jgi:hypothetical protein